MEKGESEGGEGKNMCSVVDWSEMNPELVDLIMKRLDLLEFIRAGAVCRLWWSTMNACTDISPLISHRPWLILSSPNQPEHRYVSNPAGTKSLYKFNLPNIKHQLIIGSSNGFIISVDGIAQIHATNPVTGSHRLLPAITAFYGCEGTIRDPATNQISSYLFRFAPTRCGSPWVATVQNAQRFFYCKIAIFPTSSSAGLISVIHNSYDELAFARESDESWTFIESPFKIFNDVLFYKGLLYAVTSKGDLVAFDILNFSASSIPVIHVEGWSTRHHSSCGKKYLVQSPCGSDLFLVARYRVEDDDHDHPLLRTVDFKIHKLNQDIYQWSEVSSFGTDHAVVFLGVNQSVMLLAKDIPTIAVNKGDFIYFTDDSLTSRSRWEKRKIVDMGIFCMEDKKIIPLDVSAEHLQQFSFPPPFWFTPVINK